MDMRQAVVLLASCGVFTAAVAGNGLGPARSDPDRSSPPVDTIILGLRSDAAAAGAQGSVRAQSVSRRSGLRWRSTRSLGPAIQVVGLEAPLDGAELEDALTRLASDPDVAFAEPDRRVFAHAVPADPLYAGQWYLQAEQASAMDIASAWDRSTGSAGTVVAVLDTGVRFDHPDLLPAASGGRLLPGRDFVSGDGGGAFRLANDGDGWDADASDPGDWISSADTQQPVFADCSVSNSSWHGTRVAGLIGAVSNNGAGIAGTTWTTWILPVRVLGKCYGKNSDILQAMRWAAGLPVPGVADNPYPARIINMSLGAEGACTAGYQAVINELAQAGVLVVASAGNSAGPVEYPGNCSGVTAVAGLRNVGTKVAYSSLGSQVALSAPGGNCVNLVGNCLFSLDTTYNLGITMPQGHGYTSQQVPNVGTSFSAPFVAGIAALMHAANGNLRGTQIAARLREGARPFPPAADGMPMCHVPAGSNDVQLYECACDTGTCGAGMAHAPGAMDAALRPIAAVAPPLTVAPGQGTSLDASGSAAACGRNVVAYEWSILSGTPVITGTDTAVAMVTAPVSGSFTLRVTVTDDHGGQDSADVTMTANSVLSNAPVNAGNQACPLEVVPGGPEENEEDPPPEPGDGGGASNRTSAGGGGGGAPGPLDMVLLAAVAAARRRFRGSPAS